MKHYRSKKITELSKKAVLYTVFSATILIQGTVFSAENFSDVNDQYWANRYIEYLTGKSIVSGYPDQTFRPMTSVSRQEFAVMLAKSMNLPLPRETSTQVRSNKFRDVSSGNWAAPAINAVAEKGWITGYPGDYFRPEQPISLAEMYTIVAKAGGTDKPGLTETEGILENFQDDASIPEWAKNSVASVVKEGIFVSEEYKDRLQPQKNASRAEVATTLAKLLNNSYREPMDTLLGEKIETEGTLQATQNTGEYVLVTSDNKRYYFKAPNSYTHEPWFQLGSKISLEGRLDKTQSTNDKQVVRPETLASVQSYENRITMVGNLLPASGNSGRWLLKTSDNKQYVITNIADYQNKDWFGYGATVKLTGNLRPDVNTGISNTTAVVASNIETSASQSNTIVHGVLKKTVEPGGWLVVTDQGKKYLLMGIDNQKNADWFKEGNHVYATGSLRADIPTVYMEGQVFEISDLYPHPSDISGLQSVKIYFPNPINAVKSGSSDLGTVTRELYGPDLPEKAVSQIIKGPTAFENIRGYYVDENVHQLILNDVAINGETATVRLRAPFQSAEFKSSEQRARFEEQVKKTLTQFPGIKNVSVMIENPEN